METYIISKSLVTLCFVQLLIPKFFFGFLPLVWQGAKRQHMRGFQGFDFVPSLGRGSSSLTCFTSWVLIPLINSFSSLFVSSAFLCSSSLMDLLLHSILDISCLEPQSYLLRTWRWHRPSRFNWMASGNSFWKSNSAQICARVLTCLWEDSI